MCPHVPYPMISPMNSKQIQIQFWPLQIVRRKVAILLRVVRYDVLAGAFGIVFKGVLDKTKVVAIKTVRSGKIFKIFWLSSQYSGLYWHWQFWGTIFYLATSVILPPSLHCYGISFAKEGMWTTTKPVWKFVKSCFCTIR